MPSKILIIDDYADNRELLRLMLQQVGHTVSEAPNGREGIEMAQREQPSLVLIDLSMPGLDGWSVLRELRADERTRDIPCAAVSAHADGARQKALTHGFDAYLTKPFHRAQLIQTVEDLLKGQKAQASAAENEPREEVL